MVSLQHSLPLLLLFSLITIITNNTEVVALSKQKLHHIQYVPDNIHRFIFVNQSVFELLKNKLPSGDKIQYYTHICSKDTILLGVCNQKQNTPIMLAYNKMIFSYQVHFSDMSADELAKQVWEWINLVLRSNNKKNLKEEQILKILQEQNQLVLIIQNSTLREFQTASQILSKQFPYIDVIYLSDTPTSEKYGLEIGDIVYIKNLQTHSHYQKGDLINIIKNNTNTNLLIRQAPKRYDIMKIFVLENIFTRGFTKQTEGLERQRFSIKVRQSTQSQSQNQQKRTVLVNCDLSYECKRFWKRLDQQIFQHSKQIGSHTIFRRLLYRFEIRKNIQVLQIFYHLKLKGRKFPFVFVLDGQDPHLPYLPLRYIKQLQITNNNPYGQINDFLKDIDLGNVQKISFTSGVPKKNGFTGKGSQRFIQKLTYQTYKKVLKETKQKQAFYLLYITASEFDCSQCKQFYNQLRKLAAFLHSQNTMKITFGVYDLSKDQIDLKYLNGIPSVLLFSPWEDQPVEYNQRYEFEYLMKFLKKQMIEQAEQKRNKTQVKGKQADENSDEL